jgi:aminoacrylate hydrolase
MPFADSGGNWIHFEVDGSGETLVLIPGLGGSTKQLASLGALLQGKFRMVLIDPRGAGQSDKPDIPYEASLLTSDVVAVLDQLGASAAHVVGISFGGMIAQELAIRHPARVRSLVLASSYAASDAWTDRMWEVRENLIRRVGMADHFRLAIMFLFSPRTFRTEAATIKAIETAFAAAPPHPEGYLRQMQFCRAHDSRDRLSRIGVPTLVVTGAEDILCSPLQGRELAAGIAGAAYREVPEAPHLFMLSRPGLFADLVSEFVAGTRQS